MIRVSLTLTTLVLLAACATQSSKVDYNKGVPKQTPLSQRKATSSVVTNGQPAGQPASPETASTPPPKARILPVSGRIASVNERLRFVIIDFTNSRRPELEQRLSIYRVGEKVAEVKVSGPYRNTTVAADIVTGEVKYGDEVKTE